MKNIGKVLSYGIKKQPIWTTVVSLMFFLEVIKTGTFVIQPWLLIGIFIVISIIEFLTLLRNRKIQGTLEWFASENVEDGITAWTSWKTSHILALSTLVASFILYRLMTVGSTLIGPFSMLVWWLFFFTGVTRNYFFKFSSMAQEGLLDKVKEEIDKWRKEDKDDKTSDSGKKGS